MEARNEARRRGLIAPIIAGLVAFATLFATAPAAAAPEPVPGYRLMGPAPTGANDWSCKPSRAHPRPVVLVHGTGAGMVVTFSELSPKLKQAGYCVFALNYGAKYPGANPSRQQWGVAHIERSVPELAGFINAVLRATGASKVDIVGHSQGGMLPRAYLKFANPAENAKRKVGSLVGIAPSNHGTTFGGQQQIVELGTSVGLLTPALVGLVYSDASRDQSVNSPFMRRLNNPTETYPGIKYTVIASKSDEIITPQQSSLLKADGGDVNNIWIQDRCPSFEAGHMALASNPQVAALILAALDPTYAKTNPLRCA